MWLGEDALLTTKSLEQQCTLHLPLSLSKPAPPQNIKQTCDDKKNAIQTCCDPKCNAFASVYETARNKEQTWNEYWDLHKY